MAEKRRGNKDDSKSQKKKKKTETDRSENVQITIEEIFARFPHLSEAIFVRLDDRSLASCREVNKTWQEFVDCQRIYWIRKILKYANPQSKFHEEWKTVVEKTPIRFLKRFATFVWIQPKIKSCPLYVAGGLGDIELFNCIKEKTGLNEESKNSRGRTPFHVAAFNNQISLCKAIIEKIRDKNPSCNTGETPLHLAARMGHLKVCQLIMEKLQDKSPRCKKGKTPLHMAAYKGQLKVCQLIMEKVDNKYPKCNNGLTPLHSASVSGHLDICQLIYENVIGTGALKMRDEMNPETETGLTPLLYAARFGHIEVCKFFCWILEEKNPKNKMGVTALHSAAEYGQLDVCKLLCLNLQEKNPKDDSGRTPLDAACSNKHWKVLYFLIAENNLN